MPVLTRFYTAFLNCDLGMALPKSIFPPHPFGIVITSGTEFGEDVVVGHQVTIGNRNGIMAAPKIRHRVYIGAGAKILGPVTIGDDAMVGANSVVTRDVPAGKKWSARTVSSTDSKYRTSKSRFTQLRQISGACGARMMQRGRTLDHSLP